MYEDDLERAEIFGGACPFSIWSVGLRRHLVLYVELRVERKKSRVEKELTREMFPTTLCERCKLFAAPAVPNDGEHEANKRTSCPVC